MATKRQKAPKRTTVRAKAPHIDPRGWIVDAALRLAAIRPWDSVSMSDIAQEAGMSLAELMPVFECREDIITALSRRIDRDMLDTYPGRDESMSERDALFDMLMLRFERLNEDRAALASIYHALKADPKQMIISLPNLGRSMVWVLEACRIDTHGLRGAIRAAALVGIHLYAVRVWLEDDSEDLSKTMAALDSALARVEAWAERFGF